MWVVGGGVGVLGFLGQSFRPSPNPVLQTARISNYIVFSQTLHGTHLKHLKSIQKLYNVAFFLFPGRNYWKVASWAAFLIELRFSLSPFKARLPLLLWSDDDKPKDL